MTIRELHGQHSQFLRSFSEIYVFFLLFLIFLDNYLDVMLKGQAVSREILGVEKVSVCLLKCLEHSSPLSAMSSFSAPVCSCRSTSLALPSNRHTPGMWAAMRAMCAETLIISKHLAKFRHDLSALLVSGGPC